VRLHSDQRAAIAIIVIAAIVIAITYSFDEVPAAIRQGMGPEVFPRLVAGVIIALSVWLILSAIGKEQQPLERIDRAVPIVMVGAVVFMAVLWIAGLPVAMAVALLALGWLWGERRWLAMAANAVLLPGVIWLAFVKGLKVPLPTGALGQMLGL
jgi:putative tricarboxylic transport membrane protein